MARNIKNHEKKRHMLGKKATFSLSLPPSTQNPTCAVVNIKLSFEFFCFIRFDFIQIISVTLIIYLVFKRIKSSNHAAGT